VSGLEVPGGEPALLAGLARHGVPAERAGAVTVAMGELATPVGHPRWANGLADRVSWLAAGEVRRARLELSPPDLGPLEVHITVVDDEARVAFASPHAPVREAVEGALPKLREMLGASGLSLVHVDVSSQSGGYRPPPGSDPAASPAGGRAGVVAALPVSSRQAVGEATPGLFDAYA
jgi:flagellar hook-length control protein FliK